MSQGRSRLVVSLALPVGIALLAVTIAQTDLSSLERVAWQLGRALPLAMVPAALWHLVRTIAWHRSFPGELRPGFARVFRVRLAAESFSFVTVRGVAGEPLKVVLLPKVPPAISTAAVALERIAYLVVTALIVPAAAIWAVTTLPLTN